MKRILFSYLIIAIFSLSSAKAAPGETLVQVFSNTFPDAKYARWTENGEYYIVSFTRNETRYRVWYDKAGTLVYSLRYCQEGELPVKVLLEVKKKHPDKHIDGVIEITDTNGVIYELILKGKKKWYVVHAAPSGDIILKYSLLKQE